MTLKDLLSFRRHYAGYLSGIHNIAHLRRDLMQLETVEGVTARLGQFMEEYEAELVAAA